VPPGNGWLHELKFDGYRILAHIKNDRVRLISRNGKDWTRRFPSIAAAVAELPLQQAILDGEVVSLNDQGVSSFQRLQNALKRQDDESLVYYVFDLPHAGGFNLTATPLIERKRAVEQILLAHHRHNDGVVRYSDHVEGQGDALLKQACRAAMEGIVSKRANAPYEQTRSASWLKVKCSKRQEFIITGFTKPGGSRVGFGALLLGYIKDGELVYAGRVGTGFTDDTLRDLTKQLKSRRIAKSPFAMPLNGAQKRGVTWVKPELIGEIEFTEWTDEGLLRHPTFQGLREDKAPRQIIREEGSPVPRSALKATASDNAESSRQLARHGSPRHHIAGVPISNPDRVLYPEMGLTKLGLAEYYESIAKWILPHVVNRPLTLVRCPEGRSKQCFYQKHLSGTRPEAVRGISIREKGGASEYVVIDDLAGLVSLVQMGVLEFHPWLARADNVEAPDRLIFDLDPGEGVRWKAVIDAARELRDRLEELGLETFLRTSGGQGLHVVAPLSRRNTWDELKSFARAVADDMVRRNPDGYIATLSKAKRSGRVFIDYLRNQRGATAIASYSTRAREGAPVAAPLAWRELSVRVKPNSYTVADMPRRMASLKADPWNGFFAVKQSITRAMQAFLK
jgi:bifunctional non-homologous end joining protein LigD